MFNNKWDPENNGVILTTEESDINYPIRPVFFEELDLLGFSSIGFLYPKSKEPILWAGGRNYYYKGEKIATTKGGGYYEDIKLEIFTDTRDLKPINIKKVIEKNREKLNIISQDSIDFIRSAFEKYQKKVDIATVSYSGGKDSIVLVDLVNRALDNNSFIVIFADTKMESPETYKTINRFIHQNPTVKFLKAEYSLDPLHYWKTLGSPGRTVRWCHTLFKTSPYIKKVREYLHNNKAKILTFEGVRAEESPKRSTYTQIYEGPKDITQINARPLLNWSALEIFLYIFSQKLPLNKMYRYGYPRVGCLVCPFTSRWSDYISSHRFSDDIESYITELRRIASSNGVKDVDKFISDGEWKKRVGGKYLNLDSNKVVVSSTKDEIEIRISNQSSNFLSWLNILTPFVFNENKGHFEYYKKMYSFSHFKQKNVDIYKIYGEIGNDLLFAIKRIANKAAYCIKCGACEALCYYDALSFKNKKIINQKNCIHCLNCLNFIEKGCWVALSLRDSSGGSNVKTAGNMDRYAGFGLRKEWLVQFLEKGSSWDGSGLGNKQIDSMKRWLQDSELWNKSTKSLSDLGKLFVNYNKPNDLFIWSVLWFNLGFEGNSPLIRWYTLEVQKGEYQKDELIKKLADYRGLSEANRTDINAISALCNLFEKSPIGNELEMGKIVTSNNKKEKFYRKGLSNNIPDLAVLYAIFRYAEKQQRKHLVASELITTKDSTPYWIFSLEYNSIKAILIKLASSYPELLHIEFAGNLENINLEEGKTSMDVIKTYISKNS